ncbi:pimeloyl-ACP methyl ester carboxylesterase [Micromonospora pisi]|uniref:Pimeloyl-ACP methyl ester carboxylesterase n=1 Tax=Micromonospora pisi TaxID=589240 RepID=A0A495JIH0_9ACTN|nr:alpha/beta hydrolase [Micromonospora pisi]RKR88591.1 pimeloyl-ACP methyl ester carboxylesterase [Micromonospora pisi]
MHIDELGEAADLQLDSERTVRYLRAGSGPPLVLLHTIRTQLEYFVDVIPMLARNYTVYVLDLPGHGRSSKPTTVEYDEPYLRRGVIDTITKLGLRDVTMVGDSIGAVLALTVASQIPQSVARVVASNPYDYDTRFADGIRRGNRLADVILGGVALPVVGPALGAAENKSVTSHIMQGGLAEGKKVPEPLLDEFDATLKRPGFHYVERNVYLNWRSWSAAREMYGSVTAPVTLVYGEQDWSRPDERARTAQALGVEPIILPETGHFAFLEHPRRLAEIVVGHPVPSS